MTAMARRAAARLRADLPLERDGFSSKPSRSIFLFEHDLFRKTGAHFFQIML
jgi:hypothetical protein